MAAMLLADLGATVLRITRPISVDLGLRYPYRFKLLNRGRASICLAIDDPRGLAFFYDLIGDADILIEPFRPGVAERLKIGPNECLARNPELIYGRVTGYGRTGPLAQSAGHDINYIGLSGVLHSIGTAGGPPVVPLSLVGNMGGGALFLAFGICAALVERQRSGRGQVVDNSMIAGSSSLMASNYGLRAAGLWSDQRGTNAGDGGAHFYGTYETKDHHWMAVAAAEDRFHRKFLALLGLTEEDVPDPYDASRWDSYKEAIAVKFREKTREEWCRLAEMTDACVSPVLAADEVPFHPQMTANNVFVEVDGICQPGPAPHFHRTPGAIQAPPGPDGDDPVKALQGWDVDLEHVRRLHEAGVIRRRT
jgi:alpha-methylacyl-CoA racemase